MGRIYTKTIPDVKPSSGSLYVCSSCGTHLAKHDDLISTSFRGRTGDACLFKSVVNISHGGPLDQHMTTGLHTIRHAYCVCCQENVGWRYIKAHVNDQKYKEGKYILERELLSTHSENSPSGSPVSTGVPNDDIDDDLSDIFSNIGTSLSISNHDDQVSNGPYDSNYEQSLQQNLSMSQNQQNSYNTNSNNFQDPTNLTVGSVDNSSQSIFSRAQSQSISNQTSQQNSHVTAGASNNSNQYNAIANAQLLNYIPHNHTNQIGPTNLNLASERQSQTQSQTQSYNEQYANSYYSHLNYNMAGYVPGTSETSGLQGQGQQTQTQQQTQQSDLNEIDSGNSDLEQGILETHILEVPTDSEISSRGGGGSGLRNYSNTIMLPTGNFHVVSTISHTGQVPGVTAGHTSEHGPYGPILNQSTQSQTQRRSNLNNIQRQNPIGPSYPGVQNLHGPMTTTISEASNNRLNHNLNNILNNLTAGPPGPGPGPASAAATVVTGPLGQGGSLGISSSVVTTGTNTNRRRRDSNGVPINTRARNHNHGIQRYGPGRGIRSRSGTSSSGTPENEEEDYDNDYWQWNWQQYGKDQDLDDHHISLEQQLPDSDSESE